MSPERILAVAERAEARLRPEFAVATDPRCRAYLNDRLDHCAFLRCCSWLKEQGQEVPSMKQCRQPDKT